MGIQIKKHIAISEPNKRKFNIEINLHSTDYEAVPGTFQVSTEGVVSVLMRLTDEGLHEREYEIEQAQREDV